MLKGATWEQVTKARPSSIIFICVFGVSSSHPKHRAWAIWGWIKMFLPVPLFQLADLEP